MSTTTARCPGCGADATIFLGQLPDSRWFAGKPLAQLLLGGGLYRCKHCRLKFRFPVRTADTYRDLYDNAATATWSAENIRPDWDLIISRIDTLKPLGGRVLDFGCYAGGLLSRLDARYERFGIEINRDAARVARHSGNARVWAAVEDLPADLRFDVIVLADVIEHVHDPAGLLDCIAALLDAEGVVILTTGDADNRLWNFFGANWWYCFYPEHIAFVSNAWAQLALRPRGWSIVCCERFFYRHFDAPQRLLQLVLTCTYGLFPKFFLRMIGTLKSRLGRGATTSVPGNGVSADHLLIVLSRK